MCKREQSNLKRKALTQQAKAFTDNKVSIKMRAGFNDYLE